MAKIRPLFLSALLACSVLMGTLPASAEGRTYDDKEKITNTGVDLSTATTLTVAKPASAVTTTEEKYYITGTSDPSKSLTINGAAVEARGELGTYGMQVSLAIGVNTFVIQNGGETKTATITREQAPSVTKTTKLTAAKPTFDDLAFAGEYTLTCTAPSGAEVSAKVGSQTVKLEQVAATAEDGVPAVYKGSLILEANGEENRVIPSVIYTLNRDGQISTVESAGNLTILPSGSTPTVQVNQNSSTVYEKDDLGSNFVAMLNAGAQDKIVEMGDTLAKLSMGGWIKKEFVDLVEGDPAVTNRIESVAYEAGEGGEYLTLYGTVPSVFKSYMNSEKVYLRFYHMKGITNVPLTDSELFEKAQVSAEEDSLTLELFCREQDNLLGYDVRYNEDDSITIFFNAKPQVSSGEQPLKGVTVVVDAGHGGMDPGALGVLNGKGPNEDDITMAHAIALQKRLESLGATVVMTVPQNLSQQEKVVLHERVEITRQAEADFFVSLHCNSVGGTANDLKSKGSEVYYYENISRSFAQSAVSSLAENTGRDLRGVYYSNYFVTRNSLCPGILMEMGFVSNPEEYDALRSADSLWYTANGVADAILSFLAA